MGLFEDGANAAASVAGAAGDILEDGGNIFADTAEDLMDAGTSAVQGLADTIDQTVEGNPITPIVGGLITGFVDQFRDIVSGVTDLVRDVFNLVGAVLKLDFIGAVMAIVSFVTHIIGLVIVLVRFAMLGYLVNGIVRQFHKSWLRQFVDGLIAQTFDPATAGTVRRNVGLDGSRPFGFPLPATHFVMRIDSATFPGLLELHNSGEIDLYTMSGRGPDWGRPWEVWPRPRTEGYFVTPSGGERMITRYDIHRFIDSGGAEGRLRFYAMSAQAQQQHKRIATRLHEQLGVRLMWKNSDNFSWWRKTSTDIIDITTLDDFKFKFEKGRGERWLVTQGLKPGNGEVCNLVAVGAFQLDLGYLGITVGQDGLDGDVGSPACPPGRDDSCCVTVRARPDEGSAVFHRDFWPEQISQYILAHEIGHYVGLCHYGHDSPAYIMWTLAYARARWRTAGRQAFVDPTLLHYYLTNEPYFSLADAKNCWRFLLDQMSICVRA